MKIREMKWNKAPEYIRCTELFYQDSYGFIRDELLKIYSLSNRDENKLKALELLIKVAQP